VVLRGRKALTERVSVVLRDAQRDALVLGTAMLPQRLQGEKERLADLAARGVHVRILCPVTKENADAVRGCMALGVEVRHHAVLQDSFPPGLNLLLGDGQRALLYQHIPDDTHTVKGDDVGLLVEHAEMVRGLKALAETLWTLSLPAAEQLNNLVVAEPGAEGRRTILLVEDEPDILQSLRELLETSVEGVRIRTATTAQEGLDLLGKEPVDLIISDYKLPGMSGLEMLQEARKLAPGVQRILITAFPDLKVAIRAINEAGVEHFLTKPLDSRQVVAVARSTLTKRQEQALRDRMLAHAVPEQGLPPAT
jgi:CheY-like chemotaxis protein